MKKLFNYKGLLILWITLSFISYGYLVELNNSHEYRSKDAIRIIGQTRKYPIHKSLKDILPFASLAGIALISGVGYLISKK